MPNLSVQDEFMDIKQQLAWKWKEVGLLYWVGAKCRQYLRNNGIYTLTDPNLLLCLSAHPYFGQQLKLQTVMVSNMLTPVVPQSLLFVPTNKFDKFVYLDIENSIDETTSQPNVNLVGLVYFDSESKGWKYQSFVSKLASDPVKNCIVQAQEWFETHIPKDYVVVHYTAADLVGIPAGYQTLDLFPVLRDGYANSEAYQQLHLNNFKLKTVYNKLVELYALPNLYEKCKVKNGLQALHVLQAWCKTDVIYEIANSQDECQEDIKVLPDEQIDSVIQYNYVDCLALLMLHMFMEDCWDDKVRELLTKS